MHAVVVTEAGMRTGRVRAGRVIAGRCPLCLDVLECEVDDVDGDAVCTACGGYVGRVYPRTVARQGVVRRERKEDDR